MAQPKFEIARSHDPTNPQIFSNIHGLRGKSMAEGVLRGSVEYQESVEHAMDQVAQLEDEVEMYEGAEEKMPEDLLERLQEAKANLRHLEEVEGMQEQSG